MKSIFTWFLLVLLVERPGVSLAQNNFIEGTIVYSVKIERNDLKQHPSTGTLKILLKGNNVSRELYLNTGFRNTIIFNGKDRTVYSLRSINNGEYALQLDTNELKKKQEKCSRLHIQDLISDQKTIANLRAEKVSLTCNNAVPILVYYTKEWRISNRYLFEDFPSFGYLPLAYSIKNEDGSVLIFELQSIEAKPIDNGIFKIPEGYKIISQEEYKSWKR